MADDPTVRDRILTAAQELVLDGDARPTFDAIAARSGVSKGGVLHHFRDRRALATGLADHALALIDEAMTAAEAENRAAQTWLRLSAGRGPDHRAALALISLLRVEAGGRLEIPSSVADAVARWQAAIAAEIGDPVRASVIRLVGDGLFAATLADTAPQPDELEAIIVHLLGQGPADHTDRADG